MLDVNVLLSSVNWGCEVLHNSDCECVEPQPLSPSRKPDALFVESQEDMNFDGAPVKSTASFQKKDNMPPTPQPPFGDTPLQQEFGA